MQPLVSPVDHESRNNSHRAQDDDDDRGLSESTPLIHRFPAASIPRQRGPITTAVVGFLLLILLTGVIIGIYLLVLQDSAENILPPVEDEGYIMIVFKNQWDNSTKLQLGDNTTKLQLGLSQPLMHQPKAQSLLVTHTATRGCHSINTCYPLLHEIKLPMEKLPYNFLISTNGVVYEGTRFTLLMESNALVLALIGNFTETPPSLAQTNAVELFTSWAVNQQRLDSTFVIYGKDTKSLNYLYETLRKNPRWSDN